MPNYTAKCPMRSPETVPALNRAADVSVTHHAVISRFTVANGMTTQVKEAFRNRPHLVENADGFLRMEVISPLDNPDEIWLITFWRDEPSYQTWHHGHHYRESHAGIPQGLKLIPNATEIRGFEGVSR